ncbi:hypothetical protein K8I31_16075, partial [bacterium]|nr:hypothetical protein [bacterium]
MELFIRRITMPSLIIAAFIFTLASSAQAPTPELIQTIRMPDVLSRSWDNNVLKLFDTTADSRTNRVFVSAIMTQYMAVIDGETDEVVNVIDTGILDNAHKWLSSDSELRSVYILDSTNGLLSRIDMDSGEVSENTLDVLEFQGIYTDSNTERLYRTKGDAPYMTVHNPYTLEELSIDCPACEEVPEGVGPIVFDQSDGTFFTLNLFSSGPFATLYHIDQADLSIIEEI